MFKKVHDFFSRKSKGEGITDILGTMMCILALLFIMCAFINYVKILELKRNINGIVRDNILILETNGELTLSDVDNIYTELNRLNISDDKITLTVNEISANRTSVPNNKVLFGNEVKLSVEVNMTRREIGLMRVIGTSESYKFVSEKISTSKKK